MPYVRCLCKYLGVSRQGILGLHIIHCLGGFKGKCHVNRFHAHSYCLRREKIGLGY